MPLETAQSILGRGELFQNQFIKMVDPRTRSKVYARVTGDLERTPEGVITSIKNPGLEFVATSGPISYRGLGLESIFGIKPKTPEQFLAVQYGLFNPDIDLVFICGGHGSGKTLLSYTCAVAEISDYQASGKGSSSRFNQMVLLKPNDAVGGNRRDVGALPGTLWEKLSQTLKPFENAHDYHKSDLRKFNFSEMVKHPIHSGTYGKRSFDGKFGNGWNLPKERPAIELLSFAEVRGISLEDTLIIIDEAQNFTPYELKTICERPSANTKLVILGDPAQFDNPFCSLDFNGLTCAITHYIREPYTALFEFDTNFRSPVSRHAASWKAYSQ
jgi:PhoH-like ATPase